MSNEHTIKLGVPCPAGIHTSIHIRNAFRRMLHEALILFFQIKFEFFKRGNGLIVRGIWDPTPSLCCMPKYWSDLRKPIGLYLLTREREII